MCFSDAPPSPNVSVVDTKIDHISLQWDHVPTADSYCIDIKPNPVGGACAGGKCSVINNSITIDDLPSDTFNFTITVNSVNCAGTGPSVVITEDTLPKGIVMFVNWVLKMYVVVVDCSHYCS